MAFDEYLIKSNTTKFDLLAMTIPTQPPFTNLPVCAYGGKSRLVCGKIVEFGVTITVHSPGTCKEIIDQFSNVTKVQMSQPYSNGDLGAPVYIPGQIPFDTKIIVHPVGQVVENAGDNSEENI